MVAQIVIDLCWGMKQRKEALSLKGAKLESEVVAYFSGAGVAMISAGATDADYRAVTAFLFVLQFKGWAEVARVLESGAEPSQRVMEVLLG